jgi:hypothetical protein
VSRKKWTVVTFETPEGLAQELLSRVHPACAGFRLPLERGSVLFLNASMSRSGDQTYEACLLDEEQDALVQRAESGAAAVARLTGKRFAMTSVIGTVEVMKLAIKGILNLTGKPEIPLEDLQIHLDADEVHSGPCCS